MRPQPPQWPCASARHSSIDPPHARPHCVSCARARVRRLACAAPPVYKTGGENVYPREVESVLEDHALVVAAAVVGIVDEEYGEAGHAFLQLVGGANPVSEQHGTSGPSGLAEALKAHCKASLTNFKVPRVFHIIEAMPLLPNGKVDKQALKRQATGSA